MTSWASVRKGSDSPPWWPACVWTRSGSRPSPYTPADQARKAPAPATGANVATTASARSPPPARPPPTEGLDRHRHGQQDADRPGQPGRRAEDGRPEPRRPGPPPGPAPAAPPPDGQEAADGEDEQQALGVAHDEDEGRWGEREQPDRPVGPALVAGLADDEDPQEGGGDEGGQVGHDDQGGPGRDARQVGQGPPDEREEREETERLVAERPVADAGDRLVPAGIPAEQPLVDPGGRRRARVVPVDDEVGEGEGAEDDEPGDDPLRQDGDDRPPCPGGPPPRHRGPDVGHRMATGRPVARTGSGPSARSTPAGCC